MEPESRLICSASMCQLPIRKGELYHLFRSDHLWINRLRTDGSIGHFICFRHFSSSQFDPITRRNEVPKLRKDAVPDQRILCCRFCLDQSIELERLQAIPHSSKPNTLTLQDIVETIGIRINPEEDGIPALICLTCSSKVRYIKRIQRQFQTADLKVRQIHARRVEEHGKILAETEGDQFINFAVKEEPPKPLEKKKDGKTAASSKPPDKSAIAGPGENGIVIRSIKKESESFTREVVDSSSNTVFTIQAIDNCEDDERGTDPLRLQSEDPLWIPPVKKIKEEFS